MFKYKGYDIYISDKPNKKYYAIVGNKKVYFGAKSYEHYFDIFGHYKHLNHYNKDRRNLYYKRHNKNYPEGSADWFSKKILWPLDK